MLSLHPNQMAQLGRFAAREGQRPNSESRYYEAGESVIVEIWQNNTLQVRILLPRHGDYSYLPLGGEHTAA